MVALVLLGHAWLLGTLPWPGAADRAIAPAQRRPALQWVQLRPPPAPPPPAVQVARPAPGATPARPAPSVRSVAPAPPSSTAIMLPPPGPPAALPADGRAVSLVRPRLSSEPVSDSMARGTDPLQENLARSAQRGAARFARGASDAAASASQRLAAGMDAAGRTSGYEETGFAGGRGARVQGALGSYCLRTKESGLKVDPFRQELAAPTNCPPR
ncbi:hypothetical protein BKK79_18140 [Cupriavidus sp. USMAA2-4]|uniref:hypothetical protein n=1 Tax=Cupriavidus sp. USMAA2-4 TaxID=876364 RepID=UPI0008A6F7D4|nr:hypothetical protein [Cupriavidus sp. USMAA2-4]AOY93502.1 hypothetical protein BKK79_18140 [Cupriavidus sp. USMAA2-4]